MTLMKENPTKKLEYIMSLASSGKTRREIAEELGYKDVKSLYAFTSRHGLEWNVKKGLYVVKGGKQGEEEGIKDKPTGKVATIISMFDKGLDGNDIARSHRFGSYQEMADYMKAKGYLWDNQTRNYKKEPMRANKGQEQQTKQENTQSETTCKCSCIERYEDILQLLEANKNSLMEVLNSQKEEELRIPRYSLTGVPMIKSVNFTSTIDRLAKDFSEDKNIPQKVIFEVAVIEFLKKYGYANQVKAVLNI